jgi:hypothetical protein
MENVQIFDEDNLLRRVPSNNPSYIKPDKTISSFAFSKKRDEDGVSVDLERLTDYHTAIIDSSRFRLLKINVEVIVKKINDGLSVEYNPIFNHPTLADNKAHCLICGNISDNKKKQLVKFSEEVII